MPVLPREISRRSRDTPLYGGAMLPIGERVQSIIWRGRGGRRPGPRRRSIANTARPGPRP